MTMPAMAVAAPARATLNANRSGAECRRISLITTAMALTATTSTAGRK